MAKPRYVTSRVLAEQIKAEIGYGCTQRDIAARLNISTAYLCDFLSGRREAGPKILEALGYETTPLYRKREANP